MRVFSIFSLDKLVFQIKIIIDLVPSSNSPALANLTHYQSFLLLGIPEDEREKFISRHDVEDMTTRELGYPTLNLDGFKLQKPEYM